MKKIIALLLAAIMCLSLIACGGNNAPETNETPTETTAPEEVKMSKDEMLAIAEEYTAGDIQNDSIENIARAKQKYCNKTILLSGTVRNIQEDYIELSAMYSANYIIDVYLSLDELVLLEQGQYITVVGTTTDEIIDASENVAEYTFDYSHYQMPDAYFVKDTLEVTGILKGVSNSYAPAFNIQIGESNVLKLIYFAESVDTSTLEYGQEITFVAKAVSKNDNWHYYDAEIIG
ncbi:MAG: hypothetical protein IJ491_00900 [Clostridia bacterium]|nr:hypothetical protein [Clostridia bacterium]